MSVLWLDRWLGLLAAACFVLAVVGFGAALGGYSQAMHPVALLGAHGVPHALAFNVLGLVLPGLFALQVRAIAEAACARQKAGGDPRAEIMIPLVGYKKEFDLQVEVVHQAAGDALPCLHPRACARLSFICIDNFEK